MHSLCTHTSLQKKHNVPVELIRPLDTTSRTHSLKVFYGTQTGTAKQFAEQLASEATEKGLTASVFNLKDCDPEDTLTHEV